MLNQSDKVGKEPNITDNVFVYDYYFKHICLPGDPFYRADSDTEDYVKIIFL